MKKMFLVLLLLANFLKAYEVLTDKQREYLKDLNLKEEYLLKAEKICNEAKFYWNFYLSSFCYNVAYQIYNEKSVENYERITTKLFQKSCDSFEETDAGASCFIAALWTLRNFDFNTSDKYFKKAYKPLSYFCDKEDNSGSCWALGSLYKDFQRDKNDLDEAGYYLKKACKLDQSYCKYYDEFIQRNKK